MVFKTIGYLDYTPDGAGADASQAQTTIYIRIAAAQCQCDIVQTATITPAKLYCYSKRLCEVGGLPIHTCMPI